MRRKTVTFVFLATLLIVGVTVAIYSSMVKSAQPTATHFFTVSPNQIQTMQQTANAGIASLLAQSTAPAGATPFSVVATNVAGTQTAIATAMSCQSLPPAAASATSLAVWGTVDPKNSDAGFLQTAQARQGGNRIFISKRTDLAPTLAPEDKGTIFVLHPNCIYEEFAIAPDQETIDAFIGNLPATDVVVMTAPPQSIFGKYPPAAPVSQGSSTPSPQETVEPIKPGRTGDNSNACGFTFF